MAPEKIDLVITASISPDQLMPATAARVAYGCGCVNAGAFDVLAGCAGFVYALAMAAGAVASGMRDNVLVVGAEAISRVIDWEDRSTAILFGDGAGAAVVSTLGLPGRRSCRQQAPTRSRLPPRRHSRPASSVSIWEATAPEPTRCPSPPGVRGCRRRARLSTARQHYLQMNGKEVYKFATRVVTHRPNGCWTGAATRSPTSTSSCPIRPTCASSKGRWKSWACPGTRSTRICRSTATPPRPRSRCA